MLDASDLEGVWRRYANRAGLFIDLNSCWVCCVGPFWQSRLKGPLLFVPALNRCGQHICPEPAPYRGSLCCRPIMIFRQRRNFFRGKPLAHFRPSRERRLPLFDCPPRSYARGQTCSDKHGHHAVRQAGFQTCGGTTLDVFRFITFRATSHPNGLDGPGKTVNESILDDPYVIEPNLSNVNSGDPGCEEIAPVVRQGNVRDKRGYL